MGPAAVHPRQIPDSTAFWKAVGTGYNWPGASNKPPATLARVAGQQTAADAIPAAWSLAGPRPRPEARSRTMAGAAPAAPSRIHADPSMRHPRNDDGELIDDCDFEPHLAIVALVMAAPYYETLMKENAAAGQLRPLQRSAAIICVSTSLRAARRGQVMTLAL